MPRKTRPKLTQSVAGRSFSTKENGRITSLAPVDFGENADLFGLLLRHVTSALLSFRACWLWRGPKTRAGYGYLSLADGRRVLVHRLVYQLCVGPIPLDRELCHRCPDGPTRDCFNYRHLTVCTHQENAVDQVKARRAGEAVGEPGGAAE